VIPFGGQLWAFLISHASFHVLTAAPKAQLFEHHGMQLPTNYLNLFYGKG
jgi:hypothetical protein